MPPKKKSVRVGKAKAKSTRQKPYEPAAGSSKRTDKMATGQAEGKREDYISWEEWYMGVAVLAAQRSKDPVTQVGAVIVDEHSRITGIGWNGMPTGTSDDTMPWKKGDPDMLKNKDHYVCHAELNAIVHKTSDAYGCKMYTTLFPCSECAKLITQSGIEEVIYLSDKKKEKDSFKAARKLFEAKRTRLTPYNPKPKLSKIELDFSYMGSE